MKKIHKNISQRALKVRNNYRDRIDVLRSRVSLLRGEDKLLMTMYLENGNSFRQIARLVGVNVATVARKIHKLTKRLIDGEYVTCLRNRDKFTKVELAVAKDYFLLGLTIKEMAAKHSYSIYRTRKTLKRIQQLIEATNSK